MITLITDFGDRGGYAGIMKGVILSINPRCPIVDITHHIAPQNIEEAAFVLGSAYPFFPERTVHLVVVDPEVGGPRRPIIVESEKHRFVGPDNGVFSLVFARERVTGVWEIDAGHFDASRVSATFHGRDIFAPVAARLSLGVPADALGREVHSWVRLDALEPVDADGVIKARVISVDHFGNLVSNLSQEQFGRLAGSRPFRIAVGGSILRNISRSYGDVREGEVLALFGSAGLLEIAVRNGDCRRLLQVMRGAPVEVTLL
jgi:S-adenosylmethionine hydrolase